MEQFSIVYILENAQLVRTSLRLLLNSDNLTVIETANSNEFFDAFSQNKSDGNLIVMDIELDGEDGFKVIRKIRNKNKNIPIIILSANNNREIIVKGFIEGVTDYILKPFDDFLIKDKIDKII